MAIKSGNVKLMQAQVQLDTDDGGGAMTGTEVVDGVSNNLFPDISELDRTYGRIALRKAFAAILTDDTSSFYGSHVIVSKAPADPNVSVTLFSTGDWFDRRTSAQNNVESYLSKGPQWAGHLLEVQLKGQRVIQICERDADPVPAVGQGLCLVEYEGQADEYSQYVRVTSVSSEDRTFTVTNKDLTRKVVTIGISDPLLYDFDGPTVAQFEANDAYYAKCRDTRVANAATYYGISPLASAVALGDASLTVSSIYAQLVPSSNSETVMANLMASAQSNLYVPGNTGAIAYSQQLSVSPSSGLFLGSTIYPGSLAITIGSHVFKDLGGNLTDNGTVVGTVDYSTGWIKPGANMPTVSGSANVVFMPAAMPITVCETASIEISEDARGYNYTQVLYPIPRPGSLQASYTCQGKVYTLYDNGGGVLSGSDTAFGSGSIRYTDGSVILTTGALPDAGSRILFAWGKDTTTFVRSGIQVNNPRYEVDLSHQGIAPGTLSLSWTIYPASGGSQLVTMTDDSSGNLTGSGGSGTINYGTGVIKFYPATLLNQGTVFTIDYQYGDPKQERFDSPALNSDGTISVQLVKKQGALIPKSVRVDWVVDVWNTDTLGSLTNVLSTSSWSSGISLQLAG